MSGVSTKSSRSGPTKRLAGALVLIPSGEAKLVEIELEKPRLKKAGHGATISESTEKVL